GAIGSPQRAADAERLHALLLDSRKQP
ncbi:MAG TPA: nitrate ABC transporter ATP-binding protein, partial [Achromobacter sp.]|nr:nitrate ABC transporter ATP-binding protein [Achromobacter sp.]